MMPAASSYPAIYAVVSRIPRGRVATYGQVARLAGLPSHARLVGYALNALREGGRVPWQRVVNAKGLISLRKGGSGHDVLQKLMLKREGVRFDRRGVIDLVAFRWRPRPQPHHPIP
jgi:methylated-DNA-protein-cysteine methyltransferase-like protein